MDEKVPGEDDTPEYIAGIDEEMMDNEIKILEEGLGEKLTEERINKDCQDCGPPAPNRVEEMCLLGLDVVALFPSMSAKRTGEIVRQRMRKSKMKYSGFDWRRGAVYIVMNKNLTGNLGTLWKVLPYRRKVGGTQPGMTSQGMMGRQEDLEKQWVYKTKTITEEQEREIVARVVEIAIRVVFENFCYEFGGRTFLQLFGGPIGNRLTMACARIVMTEWGERYMEILDKANIVTTLLKIYVDDVRQVSTLMRRGLRYNAKEEEWAWSEEAEKEDEEKEKEGESKHARMARILQPAMNGINPDLVFTTELEEDFEDNRLPTLDFKMWLEEDMEINHTFYEKPMKTQIMIPRRSAMPEKMKMSIASNDLNRRLSNVNVERMPEEEKIQVADKFTLQLKNSGYGRQECREIVMSGVKSWLRRHQRREKEGTGFYRSAAKTLHGRIKKKLIDKTTWYLPRSSEEDEKLAPDMEENRNGKVQMRRGKKRKVQEESTEPGRGTRDIKSVMFCPYTTKGELAKQLRQGEEELYNLTGYRIKVVEQVGDKILERLHTANPWRGRPCERIDCWPCNTKAWTEKDAKKDCTKRSLVYETWCQTCYEQDEQEIREQGGEDEEEIERRIKRIKKHKYIGETARSAYERGWEHQESLRKLEEDSHLLKHVAQHHQGIPMEKIKFGMRVRKFARSALERQVLESVLIQEERRAHLIMNSRSEYNRCSLPRLTTRIGTKEYDKEKTKQLEEDRELERVVREEVGIRRKEKCQNRRAEIHPESLGERENSNYKRRKINDNGDYKKVKALSKPTRESEKEEKDEQMMTKRRRIEDQPPRRVFLGQVMKGYVLEEPIDWEEERRKRKEFIENEEKLRQEKIKKAKRLEDSWRLSNLCREYIREHSQVWQTREEDRRVEKEEMEKEERRQKAQHKKKEYHERQEKKAKNRKITDMLQQLPVKEQERWRREQRQEEGRILKEMKDNMWKRWRGKSVRKQEGAEEIPKEEDRLDAKLLEIEQRIEEIRLEKKRVEEKKEKKRKLEEHWQMMKWLTRYIEENRYIWERRRQVQEEDAQLNELYDEWLAKDAPAQIKEIMEEKDEERMKEDAKKMKKDKARIRKRLWKDWRKDTEDEDIEKMMKKVDGDENEGVGEQGAGQVHHPREAVGEPPGQGNSPHKAGVLLAKLGEEEPGWGGAYEEICSESTVPYKEICSESTAPCNAGPHVPLDVGPVRLEGS